LTEVEEGSLQRLQVCRLKPKFDTERLKIYERLFLIFHLVLFLMCMGKGNALGRPSYEGGGHWNHGGAERFCHAC